MNPDYINQQSLEQLNQFLDPQDSAASSQAHAEPTHEQSYGKGPQAPENNAFTLKNAPKSRVLYIDRFKEELNNRGGRGLVGLLKQFKLFDTDQSGYLDKYEFKKAIEDYEVEVHPKDLYNLFSSFDADQNGRIEYNEFLQAIAGVMSPYRKQLVERVFDKLDRDGEGVIDLNDIFACFDPYRHPDVASGKNDPEGAFNDFKDMFEAYHNVMHDYNSAAKVSRQEFLDFYTYLSSQIEIDTQFDTMINGVWNLDNKNNYEEMPYAGSSMKVTKIDCHSQWLNDHHRKMFGGEDNVYPKGDGSWRTTHQEKYRTDVNAPNVTAGVPTWPLGAENDWEGGQMHEEQRMNAYYNAPQHYSYGNYQ